MKFLELLSLLLLISLRHLILGYSYEVDSGKKITCLDNERRALLEFKRELIDTHGRLSSWGDVEHKRDCCKWRGVYCDNQTNHVIALALGNTLQYDVGLPLKGMISTSLIELRQLQYLDLSDNDFNFAPIPEFIGSLSELRYLNLMRANLAGSIPHRLGNLSKLFYLDLGFNRYCHSDNLDWVSHLHALEYLYLTFTDLSKATNWLQSISKLNFIKGLYIHYGKLPDIPPSSLPSNINASTPLAILDLGGNSLISTLSIIRWFSNFSSITTLGMDYNHMPGPIPDVFANMISLQYLSLTGTGLEGVIPSYFGNMSSLTYLYLGHNNLTEVVFEPMMNLSGLIEKRLQYLDLRENNISGSLPNMSRFSSLRVLNLRANQLNGSIQESYLKLSDLTDLDLSSNQLTGPVPNLSFSSSLTRLSLGNNKFDRILLESISHLPKLESFYASSNLLEGVITDGHMFNLSRLISLDLSFNSFLEVKFSPHWIPPFQLKYFSLMQCRLGPSFPLWLRTQKELVAVDISSAGISDLIPSWFANMVPKFQYLNASNNKIYGAFPKFVFKNISLPANSNNFTLSSGKVLDLSRNKISGSVNFLCHARDWGYLDLSDNLFFGQIPDCIAKFEGLKFLIFSNNNFSGNIPPSFGSRCILLLLHLRNNRFVGGLPASLGNCIELRLIDLGENRLTGNIPPWIGERFSQLKLLNLRFNEFYGSIPSSLCDLANITILDLSSNKISGVIPNCVHKYIAMRRKQNETRSTLYWILPFDEMLSLEIFHQQIEAYFMWKGNEVKYVKNLELVRLIDLSNNNLVGEIPFEITKLVGMIGLNFSTNNLSGTIPRNIGDMKSLNFLDFSRNHLSGSIPTSLGELSFLGVLNLSYNNLSGRIPPTTQLMTFGELAYMGNSGLCGLPLNKSCPGDKSHQDSNSGNTVLSKRDIEEDGLISEGFYIALGLGFVVGFWGIFGTIMLNKAMRYAFAKMVNTVEDFLYVRVELTKARLFRHFKNG